VASTRVLPPTPPKARGVALEELTWPEVRAAIDSGTTTVLVPTGGTEQNGPHLVLGKHNRVVEYTARRIAERLGDALVAPVLAYVPEGDIDPPSRHMRYPGTISVPVPVFAAVLEHTARSFRRHGFKTICFVGDSLWNQEAQAEVAARLTKEWAAEGVLVLHVSDYYENNGQMGLLTADGETPETIGYHAGIRDTSELLAVHPSGVRRDLARRGEGDDSDVDGDPTRASAARGWALLELKVDAAVMQIRGARRAPP
jgi:creatinine amidohydrolase